MNITNEQLRRIIKEELEAVLEYNRAGETGDENQLDVGAASRLDRQKKWHKDQPHYNPAAAEHELTGTGDSKQKRYKEREAYLAQRKKDQKLGSARREKSAATDAAMSDDPDTAIQNIIGRKLTPEEIERLNAEFNKSGMSAGNWKNARKLKQLARRAGIDW